MSALVEFARRVEGQLNAAAREPHWGPNEPETYMTVVAVRRQRFDQLASRLIDTIVWPRLETLAGYFSIATHSKDEPAGRCSNWFGYCKRLPASTKVAFDVKHDVRFETVAVCYAASMMPVFIKLHEQDKLTSALDEINDVVVVEWVEQRLLEFLDAYLRIVRGGDNFHEESATDPVCGMRITRSAAVSSDSYRGHPYFFSSHECKRGLRSS